VTPAPRLQERLLLTLPISVNPAQQFARELF